MRKPPAFHTQICFSFPDYSMPEAIKETTTRPKMAPKIAPDQGLRDIPQPPALVHLFR
jgi:hypothetical protein